MITVPGGRLISDIFMYPKTRKIDWWTVALSLVSLLSFLGAAVLWIHSA